MSRVLVTGSKGVVGKKLVEELRSRGHYVKGIDLMHSADEGRCDVGEMRQLERVFSEPFDYVYHCAAEFGRWNGEDYYEQVWRTNAVGTKNLIRLQERYKFKLIHFSSSEVYGDYEDVMREDLPVQPLLNDYAMSKMVNEMQVHNSARQFGTESVIVRLFNTYGPGETYHPYRSVNARFCYAAINGRPITVHKGHMRTSTYLDDTVRTLANIVDNFIPGETYNIGGSEEHTIDELAQLVWDAAGADPSLITYADKEPMTTTAKHVDTSKAVRDLNHTTTVPLAEGVKNTVDWMRAN